MTASSHAIAQSGTGTVHEESYRTGYVTAHDGTQIGYRQIGRGPGLVLLHGAVESSQSHLQLAEALAGSYTVYLPDRRGRGLSGPYNPKHSLKDDVDDLKCLLEATSAPYVLGVSSGAVICLEAAAHLANIRKAVIFEPPLSVNGSLPMDFIQQFDREIAQGRIVDALVTGMLGAQLGPQIFRRLPRWILKQMTRLMVDQQEKTATDAIPTMKALAPTLHYDFQIAAEISRDLDHLRSIQADVLLLGGDRSPAYLKTSVRTLETLLPHAERIEISGAGHEVTGNTDQRGQPQRVAQLVHRFLA